MELAGYIWNRHKPLDGAGDQRYTEELRRAVNMLGYLVEDLIEGEDGPCRFDHHGVCQEHVGGGASMGCATQRGNAVLASIREEQE